MKKIMMIIAAYLALGFVASTAYADQIAPSQPCAVRVDCPHHVVAVIAQQPCCVQKTQERRVIIGYKKVEVRRPIYETVVVQQPQQLIVRQPAPPVVHTVAPSPVVVSTQCPDGQCAIDLHATYIGCVFRDGHQLWQYKTDRGVYNMTMQRLSDADMIRLKDGKIMWVKG